MRPDAPRPLLVGPDSGPAPPFPLRLNGKVVKGFGRGSAELGIPTANIPIAGLSVGGHEDVESGVYYGFAGLDRDEHGNPLSLASPAAPASASEGDPNGDGQMPRPHRNAEEGHGKGEGKGTVYPMVMSIGWNPFYKNTVRSVEVHILHTFPQPFYGAHMNLVILGFIRPEYDYLDRESLIADIRTDIEVARRSVAREAYAAFERDGYLRMFEGGDVGS